MGATATVLNVEETVPVENKDGEQGNYGEF